MNRLRHFTVPPECEMMSVKSFSRHYLGISSRALIKQKYADNGIMLNECRCKTNAILHTNDILSFMLPSESPGYLAVPGELTVLYEDDNFLAVDKPANMPIHPSPGHDNDSLLNLTAYHYQTHGESHNFRPMYRLDKDTSGIVWIAKNRIAASCTSIEKIYYGICEGRFTGSGIIDEPIALMEGSKIKRGVSRDGRGLAAVTHWKALKNSCSHTLAAFKLITGRTHQIRVHMSHIGHPLAGDDLYGGAVDIISRQALHCGKTKAVCKVYNLDIDLDNDFPADVFSAFDKLLY